MNLLRLLALAMILSQVAGVTLGVFAARGKAVRATVALFLWLALFFGLLAWSRHL